MASLCVFSYNPVSESTRQVIGDRRMALLLRLGQYIASSREPKDFWQQLLLALQGDHLDLPFAILYSAGGDINETLSESSELSQTLRNWTLEGLIRVPEKCTSIPKRINTEQAMEDFLPDFYDLVKQESPTLLREDDGTLPEFISREITVSMDGEHPCKSAIFLPIRSTADNVLGFMILGVNPRRQFDDDYKAFVELLSRALATSMAVSFPLIFLKKNSRRTTRGILIYNSRLFFLKKKSAEVKWLPSKQIMTATFSPEDLQYKNTKP
jgi:hypothetical protein